MEIKLKSNEIEELKKELKELERNEKIKHELVLKENNMIKENAQTTKRLCEMYTIKNETLQTNENKLQIDLNTLRNELLLLESANNHLNH